MYERMIYENGHIENGSCRRALRRRHDVVGWRGHRHRGHGGWGWGAAALGAGLLLGAPYALGAYDDGYYADGYYGDGYGYRGRYAGGGEARCEATFRSYDPATGTYMGYDGVRRACPYL
jgi:hypothetical protein